ncbi:MAG: tetratricopeptide repeat protein [Halieaceae bacterium]|jgi:tetratricopeptide (TPR) repeat protein|nr:tetratricopeptide repeat protein [Halieaceae bacterium]
MPASISRCVLACLAFALSPLCPGHPGQHDQLAEINRHLLQAPTEQSLLIQRGRVYSEGGQYEEAMADYVRARELGSPVLVAFDLGVLYFRMGNYPLATDQMNLYLERFPDYPPAYDYLARIARDAGDYDRAIAFLEIYLRLEESPGPGHYLSAARMLAETGRHARALLVLDQGLATLGVVPQLQRYAISLELAREQPELAIARLQTLRQMLRDSPEWKLDMAELLLMVGREEEAAAMAVAAQGELEGLRPTPARVALQQRAGQLIAGLHRGQAATVEVD